MATDLAGAATVKDTFTGRGRLSRKRATVNAATVRTYPAVSVYLIPAVKFWSTGTFTLNRYDPTTNADLVSPLGTFH